MKTEFVAIVINALVVVFGYYANSKVTKYRVEQLEKKVEKHNNIIHRTFILEEKVAKLEEGK